MDKMTHDVRSVECIVTQNGIQFQQMPKVEADKSRSLNFRTRTHSVFRFFDTLSDAREWAEHIVRRDLPEISVKENVDGLWELREIHALGRQ